MGGMRVIGLLGVVLLWAGCGRLSFLEEPMENFSAYYNTYYNAERALEEGIRAFEDRVDDQPIDQDVFLSMFKRSEQATTQRQPFEDAVLKSSDLLRKYPDSKWVDDAILIIGKAWFFTLNFVGAEQKFKEIFTLESPLHDEARFWLARTLIASGAYDDAFNHLQASLNAEDVSEQWEPYYRLALAELHVQRDNWEAAVSELEAGLDRIRDKDLAARASFLLGQVNEQLERPADAVAAYQSVQSYKPFYELSYAAQLSAIRVQVEHLDATAAMRWLRQMERDDKNYDHRHELAYMRGRVLIALGRFDEALDAYDRLLYDPNSRGGARMEGPVHYALGTYYRDVHEDYLYAAAHFDTAGSALGRSARSNRQTSASPPKQAPGAITDGPELARVFGSYSDVSERLAHFDSLMYLGSLDDSSFQAVILEIRQRRADEMAESERAMQRRQAESSFGVSSGFVDNDGRGGSAATGDAGFLFHRDPVRMEQARQDFILIWGDRPLAVNWRRLAAIEAVADEDGVNDADAGMGISGTGGIALPPVDFSEVPRDEESWKRMRTRRAMARYELANVLFLSMNMPDSALTWYRLVIEDDWDLPVAQRALYALAEVQTTLGDAAAARGIYEVIIRDYPNSEFAERAYQNLGLPVPAGLVTDSLGLADRAYAAIEERWQSTAHDTLIADLIDLAVTWPNSEVAPRALYGASSVFMDWAARDSLDVLGPIPVIVADSMLEAQGFFGTQGQAAVLDDTTGTQPERPPLTVNVLLRQLTRTYANSLQFKRAERRLAAFEEIHAARLAVRDSLAQARADSIALHRTLTDLAARKFIRSDSLMLTAEDVVVAGDSLLLEAPDSLLIVNALQWVPLQDYVPGDSMNLVVAEALVARDTLSVGADSVVFGRTLAIATDYIMLVADSIEVAALDSRAGPDSLNLAVGTDSLAAADSLGLAEIGQTDALGLAEPGQTDALAAAEDEPPQTDDVRPGVPDPETGSDMENPSLGNIDWSAGGYTIYIGAYPEHAMAEAFINNFQYSLGDIPHKLDIYGATVERGVEFRVGLGLFETLQDAEMVMQRAGERLPGDAKVVFVRPRTDDDEL